MRKVIVTCTCGQRMQVSRSAYGKIGICPKCNQKIRVGANGVEPLALPSPEDAAFSPSARPAFEFHERERPNPSSETDKRQFARAVDLFYRSQYAEALAILDELQRLLPFNEQVQTARARCLDAINSPKPSDTSDRNEAVSPPRSEPGNTDPPAELTEQAVRQTVLQIMTSGSTDTVRLQAAELASRILGLERAPEAAEKPPLFFANFAHPNGKTKAHAHMTEEAVGSFNP